MSDDDHQPAPGTEHPLQRAHRFFQKAGPAIREAQDAIERAGGIEGVRDKAMQKADEIVQRIDEVVADATAIEGTVVEQDLHEEPAPAASAAAGELRAARRRRLHYVEIAVIAAAATYGALVIQRRHRAA
ncbi:MAG: hypothetical protein KDC46_06550 [Thermoleophilia bacterium]|nr:hypothetical protein [Thermoleophilia bacterium]